MKKWQKKVFIFDEEWLGRLKQLSDNSSKNSIKSLLLTAERMSKITILQFIT